MPCQPNWIDISMTVGDTTPTYPGDTAYRLRWLSKGAIMTSEITVTPHVGTHIDAPYHFAYQGGIAEASLDIFAGPCLVVEPKSLIGKMDYSDFNWPQRIPPRVIFKVKHRDQGLSASLVKKLIGSGVRLIGTSSDSVDASEATEFPAHHTGLSHGLYFLENLVLDNIQPGIYELIAFPLKLNGTEASPVRACLRELLEH